MSVLSNDTDIWFPGKCEFELGFEKYLGLGQINRRGGKDIPRGEMICAKFLMVNEKDQNEQAPGIWIGKKKRKKENMKLKLEL